MAHASVIVVIASEMATYWLAGILTVAAALIVTVLMLANSRSEEDETP